MFNALLEIPNYAKWPEQTLENMCSVISRGTAPVYVEHSNVLAIGQRCISTSGFVPSFARPHSDRDQQNVLQPEIGDVLLNSTGTGTIGRSCVFNSADNFIVDGHVTLLRASPNKFRGEWLNAVLQTWWAQKHLERFCYAGSTNQLELSKSQLSSTSIPVPSINEQDEFIKILRVLNTTIHQTEAIIEKLKQVKQGLLHDLLTRGVDANGELRPSYEQAPELYQASPLGWIPKEWSTKPLSDSINLISGQHISTDLCNSVGKGVPYFTGPSDFFGTTTIVTSYTSHPQIMCNERDLLITVKGSGCGKIALAGIRACISRQLMAIRVDENTLLYWFAIFQNLQPQFNRMATGGNIPGIGRNQILDFLLSTPNRIEEMELIGLRIEAMDARCAIEGQKLAKLKLNKSALMDDLLTGRVRVTPLLPPERSA